VATELPDSVTEPDVAQKVRERLCPLFMRGDRNSPMIWQIAKKRGAG
jgi:hypothetical protein